MLFTAVPFKVTFTYRYKNSDYETLHLNGPGEALDKFVTKVSNFLRDKDLDYYCLDFTITDNWTRVTLTKNKDAPLEVSQLSANFGYADPVKDAKVTLIPKDILTSFDVEIEGIIL